MTYNRNSTRYYSARQEKKVAKALNGKVVPNSGAIRFGAGDVILNDWLIECKTKTKESDSFTIKKDWIIKNQEEAFAMRKPYNALTIDFGDGEQYYLIDSKTFKTFLENLL